MSEVVAIKSMVGETMLTEAKATELPVLTKGERTRLSILEATLRVIAASGYYAASHRAIAKEAGVSLSLTTYYFKDLQALLLEAFRLHKSQLHGEVRPTLDQLRDIAAKVSECREQGDHEQQRQWVMAAVTSWCDFVAQQVESRSQGLVVEMTFFFDIHLPESFRQIAFELRQPFIDEISGICAAMGSEDAQFDAELIAGSVQRLQYEALSVPGHTGALQIRQQLQRLLTSMWL